MEDSNARRRPRIKTPAKLSDSLNQRLSAYAFAASATGVAVLACSAPAGAAPVCKTLSDRIYFTNTYPLYFGEQTAPPFNLAQSTLRYSPSSGYTGYWWWNRGFLIPNSGGANVLLGPGNFPANLAAGSVVGPAGQFGKGASYGLLFTYGRGYPFDTRGHGNLVNHLGNFDLQKTNFVGFSFTKAGQLHYGWLRLHVTFRPQYTVKFSVIHVLGWGYEDTPNTAISAGSCSAPKASNSGAHESDVIASNSGRATEGRVSNHATLGMLAAGSGGLPLWRNEQDATGKQ